MDLMKENGLLFGTSICYTSANYKAVTSDEFMEMLISHGVRFNWYFHYMPIGDGANVDLMLNAEQREYMIHRVREIRGYTGGKPIFCIDFQNDGEYIDGCIAGGRQYAHINRRAMLSLRLYPLLQREHPRQEPAGVPAAAAVQGVPQGPALQPQPPAPLPDAREPRAAG